MWEADDALPTGHAESKAAGSWLSGCFGCLCCRGPKLNCLSPRISCLHLGSPRLRAAYDCILPRSLWVPNVPSSAASFRFRYARLVNATNWLRNNKIGGDGHKYGFDGRWVKVAAVNENWALSVLGYSRMQRAIIERFSMPLDIQVDNSSFTITVNNMKAFESKYPFDGKTVIYPRRDGRTGLCRAKVLSYTNDTFKVHLDWDKPFAGENIQTYKLTTSETAGQVPNNPNNGPNTDTATATTSKNTEQRLMIENKITLKGTGAVAQRSATSYVEFKRKR